jgi:alkanesulfonate monooxygenase
VKYPAPADQLGEDSHHDGAGAGMRIGIIARKTADAAWDVARTRFPEDRKGQIAHGLAMRVSDSHWHHQLSQLSDQAPGEANPYWLGPFQNYKTFCPYLVGSYERVGVELARYLDHGFKTFILDIPPSREELEHIGLVFDHAIGRGA